jgi:hypothetical protein
MSLEWSLECNRAPALASGGSSGGGGGGSGGVQREEKRNITSQNQLKSCVKNLNRGLVAAEMRHGAGRSNADAHAPQKLCPAPPVYMLLLCMRRLLRRFAAQAQCMAAAGDCFWVHRRQSSGGVRPLPPNLALQVQEFNREMEALFGGDGCGQGEFSPHFSSAQSLPSISGATSAFSSSNDEATSLASQAPPPLAATRELNRIERSIDAACSSGELSERERRYLRLMLRNSDQQLLRFAAMHEPPQADPQSAHVTHALLPAAQLLDVLDERISQALLQQYRDN